MNGMKLPHICKSLRLALVAALALFALLPSLSVAQNKVYRYTHVGNVNFRRGDTDKARDYYLRVLKSQPGNTRAMFNLADVYLTKGDVKAADSLYTQVAQRETNRQIRAMAWHNRGYISQTAAMKSREQQQQLLRTAIEQYKQSLRLVPQDDRTRYNLALCQKLLKENPDQNNKNQQKQQQKQNQQQKQQDKQKDKQNDDKQKNQNQQQPQQDKQKQQERQQTEQYINLAKQAEKRALEKLKQQQPRRRSLDKNW